MCQSFLLVAVRFMLLLTLHSFHTVFGHETSATSKASRQCTRVIFFRLYGTVQIQRNVMYRCPVACTMQIIVLLTPIYAYMATHMACGAARPRR